MKRIKIIYTALVSIFLLQGCPSNTGAGQEYFTKLESNVYMAEYSASELTSKAKQCIIENITNGAIHIKDSSGTTFFSNLTTINLNGSSGNIQGGAVLIDANLDTGIVSANSRVDYTARLLAHNVKSTITILSKDKRFKIKHTNIAYLQKSTGSVHNDGYNPIGKWWGSGWKDAEQALIKVSDTLSVCIQSNINSQDW